MIKVLKIEDLECAHCAAKMEDAIRKLDGVKDATVSFLAQKITIDGDESKMNGIVAEAVKICKRIEPDCEVIL